MKKNLLVGLLIGLTLFNVNAFDVSDFKLRSSVESNDLATVKEYIGYGADVNEGNVLGIAISKGYYDIAKYLVEKGADVNNLLSIAIDAYDSTNGKCLNLVLNDFNIKKTNVLIQCVRKDENAMNQELLQILIDNKADINATSNDGNTALMIAVEQGKIEFANILLRAKSDVNQLNKTSQLTPLMLATEFETIDVADFLIECGAKVNNANNNGATALMIASALGNLDMVAYLITKGAKVNAKRKDGITSLMLASDANNIDVAELLIRKGADANAEDNLGKIANDYAQSDMMRELTTPKKFLGIF